MSTTNLNCNNAEPEIATKAKGVAGLVNKVYSAPENIIDSSIGDDLVNIVEFCLKLNLPFFATVLAKNRMVDEEDSLIKKSGKYVGMFGLGSMYKLITYSFAHAVATGTELFSYIDGYGI